MLPELAECDSTSSNVQQQPHTTQPTLHLNQQSPDEPDADVLTRPNFGGIYGFKIVFPREDETRCSKDSSWTYSESMDELFTKMNVDCPVQVQVSGPVPYNTFLRVSPYYRKADDDQNGVPKRCLNHNGPRHELNRDHHAPKHLIRSYMPGAEHVKDQTTKRREVLLPCSSSYSTGVKLLTYVLRFMCRSSCPGGMNRRPFCVVFTLENNGVCLGRQVKKVHVSACPRRDRKLGEKRLENAELSRTRPEHPEAFQHGLLLSEEPALARDVKRVCKRIASTPVESGKHKKVYKLKVHSQTIYNILCAVIPLIDANMRGKDQSSTEDEA